MPTPIAKEIKEQILARVKEGKEPAAQIAREAGVNPKTVYGWVEQTVIKPASLIELNRLKREQAGLYQLIGRLTSELDQQKGGTRQDAHERFGGDAESSSRSGPTWRVTHESLLPTNQTN